MENLVVSCILAFYREHIRLDVKKLCEYPILEELSKSRAQNKIRIGKLGTGFPVVPFV